MPLNFVTVTATWSDQGAVPKYAEGNYMFIAAGTLMSSSAVAIVIPVIQGQLAASTPSLSVSLLASDNFSVGPPPQLVWDIHIAVKGIAAISVQNVAVNFSGGASQGLFTILTTAGWVPTPNP